MPTNSLVHQVIKMGFLTKISLLFFILSFMTFSFAKKPKMDREQRTLTRSINSFAANFYTKTTDEIPSENLIMSPLSVEILLALLSLGARGKTQKELNDALHLSDENTTKSAFKTAIQNLKSLEGVTLSIANKIFVKEGPHYDLHPDFKNNAVENFFSEIENLNFSQNKIAAKTINSWVESKTNNKIKDFIHPRSLHESTKMILVNAIHFKGKWKNEFPEYRTRKGDFFLTPDNKIQVDMMHDTDRYPFADVPEWDAKVLEMPYKKEQMSMMIILPNKIDGLKNLKDKLASSVDMGDVFTKLNTVKVEVALPKFKIETVIDLKKVLSRMRMKMIFDSNKADLSGLLEGGENLVVSEAIQKAFIEVNEKGTEAAAATRFGLVGSAGPSREEIIYFTIDHPFIFLIKTTNQVIFIGSLEKTNACASFSSSVCH